MKKEVFDKAQKLNQQIADLDQAIEKVDRNSNDCSGKPLNIRFFYPEDVEELKTSVLSFLKQKRAKLQKEFDGLK